MVVVEKDLVSQYRWVKGDEEGCYSSDSQSDTVRCKAKNKKCNSLKVEGDAPLAAMPCDVCCNEPGFCRDCLCILCAKTINSAYGGYSYIKCEAMVEEGYICAHVAHLDCALRSYMAGTVGGRIGLDAEYHCRRCDARTDLLSHAKRLIRTCQSIDSRHDIEKILNLGVCLLRGTQRATAKRLLNYIVSAMEKLKSGTCLEDIWEVEVNISEFAADDSYEALDFSTGSNQTKSVPPDHQIDIQKLEDEIHHVLQALKKSQESEYKLAGERLCAQKNYIHNLYQQLDKERSEMASSADPDALHDAVMNKMEQIKWEIMKLRDMEEVANGFGRTSKAILNEHFGLDD